MKVLLDTNIVLDLLLDRRPWSDTLAPLVAATVDGRVEAWVAGTSFTNVFQVARKLVGIDRARAITEACLASFLVAPMDAAVLRGAMSLRGRDFEDDVQIVAAQTAGLDGVLTRDPKGFSAGVVVVWSPESFAVAVGEVL